MNSVKYPRTPHLPFSPGYADDDEHLIDFEYLKGEDEIICTEKMDGENTTLYHDHWHSRSINSNRKHESRDWMANFWSQFRSNIPPGTRICGENLYAQHSIPYKDLKCYFYVHSMWSGETCVKWDEVEAVCLKYDLAHVPVLYRGPFSFEALTTVAAKLDLTIQEGFVVRTANPIHMIQFNMYVAKWCRINHVNPDEKNWFGSKVIKNGLRK